MARHSVDSSHEPVRHVDDHDIHDTILHQSSVHGEPATSATKPTVAKICALCGDNVAGRKRYKDRDGRYYCEVCFPLRGEAPVHDSKPDNATRPLTPAAPAKATTTVTCPDCGGKVDPGLIVNFHGASVCASCAHTRELSAKREVARIAAAEEEAQHQAARRRTLMMIALAVLGLFAVYGAMQLFAG